MVRRKREKAISKVKREESWALVQGQSHSTSKVQTPLSSWWDSDSSIAQVCGWENSYRVTLQDPECGSGKILKSIFKNWVKNMRPQTWEAACRRTQPRRSWRNEKERSYADTMLIYNTPESKIFFKVMKTTESREPGNMTAGDNQTSGILNLTCHSPRITKKAQEGVGRCSWQKAQFRQEVHREREPCC